MSSECAEPTLKAVGSYSAVTSHHQKTPPKTPRQRLRALLTRAYVIVQAF